MGSDHSTVRALGLSDSRPSGSAQDGRLDAGGDTGRDSPSSAGFVAALNQEVLRQGIAVIAVLDDEQFAAPPAGLAHSGAGAHFRHIFDYYRCFLRDVEVGRVDYDLRERDLRFESEREHAIACLEDVIAKLDGLFQDRLELIEADRVLEARMDAVGDAGSVGHWNRTTVQRELRFLVSHTIHHYALIALILKVKGFECGSNFGVAPSTAEYWKSAGR